MNAHVIPVLETVRACELLSERFDLFAALSHYMLWDADSIYRRSDGLSVLNCEIDKRSNS